MRRIGIIASMQGELKPLVRGWRSERKGEVHLWRHRHGQGEWVAACAGSGVGAATRAFSEIEKEGPLDLVLSTGWAGALREEFVPGVAYLVTAVVDAVTGERFETEAASALGSTRSTLLVTNPQIAGPEEKRRLAEATGAGLVDMEAAGVARLAGSRGIPFRCVKGVSDGPSDLLPDLTGFIDAQGRIRWAALIVHLLLRPWLWAGLTRIGKNSKKAAQGLRACLLEIMEPPATLLERGWAALPSSYRMPDKTPTLEEARAYCRRLAESHYENFHVVTRFLPKALRPHFHVLYSYCRIADDLGDEVGDKEQALALLDLWGQELDACYEGRARHPVFVALAETIRQCSIPKEPFADLLVAFRQDQAVSRYATMSEVLGYCRYSAAPVGRLVLYVCGEADEERFRLSDATCAALQLANFWQDVRRDFAKGRVYLPQEDMKRFEVSDATIANGTVTPGFRRLIRHEVEYARRLFEQGWPLAGRVRRELAIDLDLFSRGGLEILRAIEQQDFDVLTSRPSLSKAAKARLLLRALAARTWPFSLRPL